MPTAFTFAVYALACARVTSLLVTDRITEAVRVRLIRRFCRGAPDDDCQDMRAYFLLCQWCMSIWIAVPFAAAWWWGGDWPWTLIPAAFLAFSQITGMISSLGR